MAKPLAPVHFAHEMRFRWYIFVVVALLGLPLRAAEPATLTLDIPVLVAGYGTAFFEETARQFEALRPGVKVRLYGDPRINDQVRIRVMAGDLPDASDAVLLYPNLIQAGCIVDLAPYLDGPNWEGDAPWRDSFLPGVLDRWTATSTADSLPKYQQPTPNNQHPTTKSQPPNSNYQLPNPNSSTPTYGLPFAHAVWTIFYDKKRFRDHGWEVPRTWDEFFALCERMDSEGVAPLALPGVFMRYGDAFLRSAHYNLVGPEGWRAYNTLTPDARTDPRFIRAAEVVQRLSTRHLVKGWEGMTHTAAQLAFLEGRAAMTVSASWFVNEMRGKLPEGFELGAMNFPVFADGITPADTLQTQSAYYFLFARGDPPRERATVDFFRYLTSRERARRFAQTIDSPVALRAVGPADYSPAMRDTAAMIARSPGSFDAAPPASAAALALINQTLADARYRLMTGRLTPAEFGARLEAAAATERARRADPDRVENRHGLAAAALLGTLAALVAWLGWRARAKAFAGGSSADKPRTSSPASEHLGRLRGPFALGFVGPSLLLFGAFVIVPGATSLAWALTRWDGLGERTWAGLFNFKWLLLESDVFWFALRNNLYLMVVPALVVVPTALLFAALIHRGVWGASVFRVVFLFPNLLGGIAATLLWMSAYAPHGGLVNTALVAIGFTGFDGFAWLSQGNLYLALIPIYLWMACGFNLVLYLAAMQGVPTDLYEAADLEGASPLRQFFTITIPLIWEVLVISAVFLVIGGLNAFEMVWLLTSQDPASGSHTLSTFMVSTMFQEFQIGRATAIAVVLFALVLAGSAAVMRALRRDTVEM